MPLLDKLREQYGVGSVCSELHIAPSTYYHCQQQRHHPDKRSARAQRDDWLKREIQRVYDENHQVYGVRKVWRQLLREGIRVARCTVARLMAVMGLAGVLRGKKVRTTVSRKAVSAGDRVNRQFVAERPDQLWVADFTYVSTWQGFVYVAFIIDVFAGCIVGWRVSSSMETTFVLDALEQALWARRPSGTVHHSDKGSQYVSLAYTERLKEAKLLASTGSTGDSYDNAMAESINGLYKAEVIHRKSWKNRAEVELATLTWVDWYNNRRLLGRLGHIPPAEAEKAYYASIRNDDSGSLSSQIKHSPGKPGRFMPRCFCVFLPNAARESPWILSLYLIHSRFFSGSLGMSINWHLSIVCHPLNCVVSHTKSALFDERF